MRDEDFELIDDGRYDDWVLGEALAAVQDEVPELSPDQAEEVAEQLEMVPDEEGGLVPAVDVRTLAVRTLARRLGVPRRHACPPPPVRVQLVRRAPRSRRPARRSRVSSRGSPGRSDDPEPPPSQLALGARLGGLLGLVREAA